MIKNQKTKNKILSSAKTVGPNTKLITKKKLINKCQKLGLQDYKKKIDFKYTMLFKNPYMVAVFTEFCSGI